MAAVLMSVGLSVDFTAHISYHFQLRHQRELRNGEIIKVPIRNTTERLQYTLQSVGWPIILAGASTIICVIPLLFLQSYAPTVFFKTIILVVSWGLVHGLIVLPSILAALPTRLTTANCYHLLLIQENKQNTSQEMDMFEKRALTVDLDNTV
ncbi:hypothetical protein AB6A40_004431 [Gnathostoma spinigerum]|uniref:Uncharacterized protein n=1 Tax=Gnathostoma spinigerum TaxID=75299 RepID=A0ABD6EMD1_9BILA